jgi:hypothetical protein
MNEINCSDGAVWHSELLGFWTLPIIRYSEGLKNTAFRKLDLFPPSGEGGKTPTLLGPLERVNFNHWTQQSECIPSPTWGRKQIQFPKRCIFFNTGRWTYAAMIEVPMHQSALHIWPLHIRPTKRKMKDVVVVVTQLWTRYQFFSRYCSLDRCRKQAAIVDSVHTQWDRGLTCTGVDHGGQGRGIGTEDRRCV